LSKLLSFIKSQTLAIYKSQYSGEIKVVQQFGQRKIYAGNLLQSGSIIKQLWQKPLSQINKNKVTNILILGFGGGTAAQMLLKLYPNSQITGIEIDLSMIDIYEKYFQNDNQKNIKVIHADCFHWVNKCSLKYDLILIDLYQGYDIPSRLYSTSFIHQIKNILQKNGIAIINHLFFDQYKKRIPDLIKTLESDFTEIKLLRSLSNIFLIFNY